MSTLTTRPRTDGAWLLKQLQNFGSLLTVMAIAVFGFWGGHWLLPNQEHSETESASAIGDEAVMANSGSAKIPFVKLTDKKLAAADIQTAQVQLGMFQSQKSIPGTIAYDSSSKFELRAAVRCLVEEALVKQADQVTAGQPLLRLTSPEIATARSEITQAQASLDLLKHQFAWKKDTHENVRQLLALLQQFPASDQIAQEFDNKSLGQYRDKILSAYSGLMLAKKLADRSSELAQQGVIAGKTADQRNGNLEVASARFNSVREELKFQIDQDLTLAKTNIEAAEKRLEISRDKLTAMLGGFRAGDEQTSKSTQATDFVLTAPRSGQIVSLPAVESARFDAGELLAEIADTSTVWVEAQISQRDWHSLVLTEKQLLTVRVPSLPNQNFAAVVRNIGTAVSPTTFAIPLIVELANHNNHFRPGMSVWADVPTSLPRSAILVPVGSIQRNEMQTFVFVKTARNMFEQRSVVLGGEWNDQIEIKSGLKVGEELVTEGAFFLKSELLLEAE